MFDKLKHNLEKLQQEIKLNKDLKAQDKVVLAQLSRDLQAHASGHSTEPRHALIERTNLTYEQFREDHPELATLLQSAMQVLQNMGV